MGKEIDTLENTSNSNTGQVVTNITVNVEKALHVNNSPRIVESKVYINANSSKWAEAAMNEAGMDVHAKKTAEKPDSIRVTNMTYRQLLEEGIIDISKLQKEIMKYVEAIREFVKDDKDKLYLQLWSRIMEHKAFAIDLYDRGKQESKFNRNLVGNIIHYLDSKGFYKKAYNQSEMTRAFAEVTAKGDKDAENKGADDPARKGLRSDPILKYKKAIDEILEELQAK